MTSCQGILSTTGNIFEGEKSEETDVATPGHSEESYSDIYGNSADFEKAALNH